MKNIEKQETVVLKAEMERLKKTYGMDLLDTMNFCSIHNELLKRDTIH